MPKRAAKPTPKKRGVGIKGKAKAKLEEALKTQPTPPVPTSYAPRGVGRPTALTPEVFQTVCEIIEVGAPIKYAYQAVGVAEDTFYGWEERGKKDQAAGVVSVYSEFSEAIKIARAKGIVARCQMVHQAGIDGNWQAAAWWLERMLPRYFARTEKQQISGKLDTGKEQTPETMSDEQLEAVIQRHMANKIKESKALENGKKLEAKNGSK